MYTVRARVFCFASGVDEKLQQQTKQNKKKTSNKLDQSCRLGQRRLGGVAFCCSRAVSACKVVYPHGTVKSAVAPETLNATTK